MIGPYVSSGCQCSSHQGLVLASINAAIFYLHRGQTVVHWRSKNWTVLRGINALNEELTRVDRGRVFWTSICQKTRGISHNVLHVEINHEA